MTAPTTVAWWTHRPPDLDMSTGLSRYVVDCLDALERRASAFRYELWAGRDADAASRSAREVHQLRGSRRALHASWMAAGRPRIERRWTSAARILHLAYPAFPVPSRLPTVVTVHDVFPLSNPEWFGRGERTGFALAIRRLADTASVAIVDSPATERELLAHEPAFAGRTVMIPLGISDRFYAPVAPGAVELARASVGVGDRPYVLSIGRASTRKNHTVLVDAVADLDVDLVVAGPHGEETGALQAQADAVAPGRVHLTGAVDDGVLLGLLAGADGLVHPARDEGFGFPPLEAMAARRPVVSSRGGSLDELVADVVTTCDPDDVEAWAAAISALADTPAARMQAAYERSLEYRWDHVAERYESVYESVLAGSG